jgi:hypothetical protein
LAKEELDSSWSRLVKRRKFLQGLGTAGIAGAALPATTLFAQDNQKLSRGDAKLLQLALTIELIEADLWQQYNELGGAVDHNDQPNPGNPAYVTALQNLDGDMPQYISDNTDDEISHAAFLSAYLKSKGEVPVDLTPFANLQGSQATGAKWGRRENHQPSKSQRGYKLVFSVPQHPKPRFRRNLSATTEYYESTCHPYKRHRHSTRNAVKLFPAAAHGPQGAPHASDCQHGGISLFIH